MQLPARDGPRLLKLSAQCLVEKDYEGAQTAAAMAVTAAPDLFEAWVALGVSRAKFGDHGGAVEPFIRALALQPKAIQCWCDLGECYLTLMRYKEAAASFKQAMLLDPESKHPAGRRARAVSAKTMAQLRK